MICWTCFGRGWVVCLSSDWAGTCPTCDGHGALNTTALARILGVDKNIIRRVQRAKPIRAATAARIIAAVERING